MTKRDPEMYRGLLEVVEMFRNRDKEGLKMYLQKFLPHMDDPTIEDFIIGGGGTEGIRGQLIRLGSGRDYAGKLEMMKKAVDLCGGKVITEASGGINLNTVKNIAETGVDLISVGAITHSADNLDLSFDIK